jgi:Mg2+ and Co2+ transporter CorA
MQRVVVTEINNQEDQEEVHLTKVFQEEQETLEDILHQKETQEVLQVQQMILE